LREELDLGDRPCVVYTGNFEAYQGVELLVDAMARVRERRPDAVAVLAGGEARHRAAVRERILEQGLEGHVRLAGERPLAEMPAFLTLAAVLASPRVRGTNTALKLYGYMQTGRPVVATRLETHTQVLDEGCAWLTPAESGAFAGGILQALERPEEARRRGAAAAARVEERYSLERFDRQVAELYRGLGGGRT
jgi:glycosyltransferase involved in cell wall biosynthesis